MNSRYLSIGLFVLIVLLFHGITLAQDTTYQVNFSQFSPGDDVEGGEGVLDLPNQLIQTGPANFTLTEVPGLVGNTDVELPVLTIDVAETDNFRLVDFEGLLSSGILTEGTVKVAYDLYFGEGADGFVFMRAYDESFESFADIGFSVGGNTFNSGVLNYEPETGEYLGWLSGPGPLSSLETGRWYRFESVIDLNANEHRLRIDGQDYGVVGGISRATGTGYAGFFFNWGTSFTGESAIDNFVVSYEQPDVDLPTPPAGFLELLEPANHGGGTVLRLPNGDFRAPGIAWSNTDYATLIHAPVYEGVSTYRINVNEGLDEADARLFAAGQLTFLPNRTYEVSILIRTNFPRATYELNIGPTGVDASGFPSLGSRYGGMPAVTEGPDGWERWTWRFTPHWLDPFNDFTAFIGVHEYGDGFDDDVSIEIADVAFIECPPLELDVFPAGEGVTFAGGSGELEMRVDSVRQVEGAINIYSTGARYELRLDVGKLVAHQQIDFVRELVELENLPLAGLEVISSNDSAVVLSNTSLTIGILNDGVMVIHPHASELSSVIRPTRPGDWNRAANGDLISQDDFGGFTVNHHVPLGSGRPTRLAVDESLPFVGLNPEDLVTTGATTDPWTANISCSPGERIFVSVFPSRHFDWEKSFDWAWEISDFGNDPSTNYNDPDIVKNWVLWNFTQRGWAQSYGERYNIRPDVDLFTHVDSIENRGERWSTYFSQWFYYSRDPDEWAEEALRWRDEYGMSAIYSDGLAQDDWLSAYRAMRRLRGDVFPDGDIIIHDSYPQSGIHAAGQKPFIYNYATATYMGENAIVNEGADWA